MRPSAASSSRTRLVPGELGRGGPAGGLQGLDGDLLHLLDPAGRVVGQAGPPDQVDQQAPLLDGDGVGAGGLDHRHQLHRLDEHGPAHAEEPDQHPVVVQGPLHGRDLGDAHPGPGGQVDGCRVGAVQADQVPGRLDHPGPGRGGQAVAQAQPGPPLLDPEASHRPTTAAAPDSRQPGDGSKTTVMAGSA
jgi:hypothetical protein